MLSFEDVNVLGQLIDTSFGYSSTGEEKYQVPAGRSIKSHISGETGEDRLIVKFTTVVNYKYCSLSITFCIYFFRN